MIKLRFLLISVKSYMYLIGSLSSYLALIATLMGSKILKKGTLVFYVLEQIGPSSYGNILTFL